MLTLGSFAARAPETSPTASSIAAAKARAARSADTTGAGPLRGTPTSDGRDSAFATNQGPGLVRSAFSLLVALVLLPGRIKAWFIGLLRDLVSAMRKQPSEPLAPSTNSLPGRSPRPARAASEVHEAGSTNVPQLDGVPPSAPTPSPQQQAPAAASTQSRPTPPAAKENGAPANASPQNRSAADSPTQSRSAADPSPQSGPPVGQATQSRHAADLSAQSGAPADTSLLSRPPAPSSTENPAPAGSLPQHLVHADSLGPRNVPTNPTPQQSGAAICYPQLKPRVDYSRFSPAPASPQEAAPAGPLPQLNGAAICYPQLKPAVDHPLPRSSSAGPSQQPTPSAKSLAQPSPSAAPAMRRSVSTDSLPPYSPSADPSTKKPSLSTRPAPDSQLQRKLSASYGTHWPQSEVQPLPHELLLGSVNLGRGFSGARRGKVNRPAFPGIRKYGLVMRSAAGKVEARLLAHAFSLQGEGLDGSALRETLREVATHIHYFGEAARSDGYQAQEKMKIFLPVLMNAMLWAANLLEPTMRCEDLVEGTLRQLADVGRVLLPVQLLGLKRQQNNQGRSREGHALVVEIARCPDNTLAIKVFNTGYGLRRFHKAGRPHPTTGAERYAPFEVRGIQASRQALQAVLGPLYHGRTMKREHLDDALARFYADVAALGVVTPPQDREFKPQICGNCTWKCIMAFLRSNCDELTYRTFKLYMRSRIFHEAAAQWTADGFVRRPASTPQAQQASDEASGRRPEARGQAPAIARGDEARLLNEAKIKVERDLYRLHDCLMQLGDTGRANRLLKSAGIQPGHATKLQTEQRPQSVFSVIDFVEADIAMNNNYAEHIHAKLALFS